MEIEESGPGNRRRRVNVWWMTLSIVSSGATAYIMAIFGWIPVNPVYAVIMGSIFGLLFVLYQLFSSREMLKRMPSEELEADGELL